jgi:hypothetical protein
LIAFSLTFSILFAYTPKLLADVTISSVVVDPATIGVSADYQINMQIGSAPSASITQGGSVYVQFDSAYTLPLSISTSAVRVGGYNPSSVSVNSTNNTIGIVLSNPILSYQIVLVEFFQSAGIVNPALPSLYSIKIWTSSETTPVTAYYPIGSGSVGNAVTGLQIVGPYPADSGKPADYTIRFNATNNGALLSSNGDYVDVFFPAGTSFPSQPDASKVLMKHYPCSSVQINGQRVRVFVPDSLSIIFGGSECNIEFTQDFGIKNPLIPGSYALQVSTSKDTGVAVSNIFQIVGTVISLPSITVEPSSQATIAKYTVNFRTSQTGALSINTDKIFLTFPNEATLPTNVIPGAIQVNGTPCVNVSESSNTLEITTPINISTLSDTTIIIFTNFGIKNPSSMGNYTLKVYTSEDTVPVDVNFTITSSTIGQPAVLLSSLTSGQVSKYTINFTTGASGDLSGGIDKINVIFPVGTTVPSTISNSSVTVNNIPSTNVAVNGTTVTITMPISILAYGTVSVVISESAQVKSPVYGGSYKLFVNTTKEITSIESVSYVIYTSPVSTAVVAPAQPDGLNGYYKVVPKVTISATSSIDPNPVIYYYFDTNTPVAYSGNPINAQEGVHTLFFYAVDNQGHQEQINSINLKVDTIPPQITIISPQNNAILNNKTVTVNGQVDVGSSVKINGTPAPVDQTGHFTLSFDMSGTTQVINITAVDTAGNTSSQTLTVSLDTTPPILEITLPVAFQDVRKLPLLVQGKTEKGALVTVNGNTATVEESGNFSYLLNSLNEGVSIVEIVAKDPAGNITQKFVNVKYTKTTIIKLQIGNKVALINDIAVALTGAPVIKLGRTYVPLRFVSEAFGATVSWDPVFQLIDITLGSYSIRLQIGVNFASVNGKKVSLDAAPLLNNGTTIVPVRFVSEILGSDVAWDDSTKTVTVIYPKQ